MATAALSAIAGPALVGRWSQAAAQQSLTEDGLLDFDAFGNVTLVHITDIHAQLMPVYFREPSVNLGVGEVAGLPPHVTGADLLKLYNIEPGSPHAYALTSEDFSALAKTYGKMGGIDRIATIVKRIRAERGDNMLLLDGGDTWQGSYTSLQTKGQDMVEAFNALSPDAMTGLEANLRFAGPETMETKIFGRLTAWQNWIFQRPNAVGEKGALNAYGQQGRPEFDWKRT